MNISKDEYLKLKICELKLNLLERGGVDNWEWYNESLNPENEKSYNEMVDEIKEKIKYGSMD